MKGERPAFVQVPIEGGGTMTAVVASRDGLAPVILNGVEHVGLLLSVNAASATIAVMTLDEADAMAVRIITAAATVRQRLGLAPTGVMRKDVSQLASLPVHLRSADIGAFEFEVIDGEGATVPGVVEINTDEGWIIREKTDDAGAPIVVNDEFVTERVDGPYTLRRLRPDG